MIATQSNSNVNDEEDAPCKSGVDNCGAERGTQALWVKVTPHSFTDSQPPPHCIGRAGSRDRGCGVCAQGLTQQERAARGEGWWATGSGARGHVLILKRPKA